MVRKSLFPVLLLGAPLLFGACSDEPAAELIIDRKSFDFGEWEVGKPSGEQLFTVRNNSPQDVESVSVSIEGSDTFVISSNTCEKYLAAGLECELRVRFTPRLGGASSARLKVAGASSVLQTELQGTGFAWVEVTSMPPGTYVDAGDDSFTCTQPCRHAVRKAELTLYAGPEGFPTWSKACAGAPRGGCQLRLDASKSVALEAWSPVYQWEVRRSSPPVLVAPLGDGRIVVQDALGVTALDGAGQERWSLPLTATAKLAVTSDGFVSLLRYDATVTQYDRDGRVRWTYTPEVFSSAGPAGQMVADVLGNTYVLLAQGSNDTAVVTKLVVLSREGVETWSAVVSEAQITYPLGLGIVGNGSFVYVAGTAYNRGPAPQELVFVKNFVRKLTSAGAAVWTKERPWGDVAFSLTGEMISVISIGSPPGGFRVSWMDSEGNELWNSQTPQGKGPGVVDTYAFPAHFDPVPRLLFGGHELRPGIETYGRGWFGDMGDSSKLSPGPITYIDSPSGNGAWVSTLTYADPARHVVVGGGFGDRANPTEGFIRLYDPRALTTER
ncbi:choice-of-anchor D domain-containing protein [Corallococcus aberystwythensis]|uniref:Choice-of-anchor D domain-containing protein n=1 Tax=Corallococcus aberystwythensis TaxID=2316722 RepID=A0A3A8QJK1_9BACT|nr:choice-of-anchor D domain-containing protein [Corallococcus aberystwythensis]RKH67100.1 choice-of-anchor D domain-containing protein [Corallococcus aberystwythensis]